MTRAKFVRNTMETIGDLKEKASTTAATTYKAATPVLNREDSDDIPTTQSSASVETNSQQAEKMNRGNGFLPISDGVFSVLSSASIASSRWMLRRSISSKSFNSVPSTSRRSSSTTATKQNKRNSVTSGNHRNNESENDENKFAVKSIDSRESWLGDMENLLKMNQILQNSQHIERIQQQQQSTTDICSNNNIVESPTTKNQKELKNSYITRRRRGQSLISPLAGLSGTFDDISLLKQKRRLSHSSTDPNIYALDKDAYEKTATNNGVDIKMCKEGLVMQKHVMEDALKKARYRGWQSSFLIVREGKIDLCRPPSISKEQKRKSLWGNNNSQYKNSHIHDFYNQYEQNTLYNNFKKDEAELIQSIDLKHSVANTLPPPGWHGERHHVFSLQTSNGAVWLFESHNMESTLTWVTCCNYWAALLSKESLPGAVCNLDYGWTVTTIQNNDHRGNDNSNDDDDSGKMNSDRNMENHNSAGVSRSLLSSFSQQQDNDDDGDEDVVISHWIPPAPSMITSQISETEKVLVLERHLISLQYEIKEHRIAREIRWT
ncbi:hypothetical protein INT45_012044 [Circinella minor]|uniref:PH domain-containing protein n=1 Tax=Circinella minor TaxID=1195481 RepID=A0A8H7VPA1_9FUNG|nr:hypothetical protein INT45_012044 [Circinella minor]